MSLQDFRYEFEEFSSPDQDVISQMTRLHLESFDEPWREESFRNLLNMKGSFGYFIRLRADQKKALRDPVGFILFLGDMLEVDTATFAVSPDFRGKGAGYYLMCHAILEIKRKQIQKIFLEAAETNLAAIALYKKCGFREIGRRKNYYGHALKHVDKIISFDALTYELRTADFLQ